MRERRPTKLAATIGALALLAPGLSAGADARSINPIHTSGHASTSGLLDQRSPDTIDAAAQTLTTLPSGIMSPDTRDAALAAHASATAVSRTLATPVGDLRSPDTRDAARSTNASREPRPLGKDGGFDWTDAGIGATSGLAIAFLAVGALLFVRRSNGRRIAI